MYSDIVSTFVVVAMVVDVQELTWSESNELDIYIMATLPCTKICDLFDTRAQISQFTTNIGIVEVSTVVSVQHKDNGL